jgi:hypothetical protein
MHVQSTDVFFVFWERERSRATAPAVTGPASSVKPENSDFNFFATSNPTRNLEKIDARTNEVWRTLGRLGGPLKVPVASIRGTDFFHRAAPGAVLSLILS